MKSVEPGSHPHHFFNEEGGQEKDFAHPTLAYTIYDGSGNGNWRVISIKFLKPVSYTANVTAKCPGID